MYRSAVAFALAGLMSACTTTAQQPAQAASASKQRQCEVVEDEYTESLIKRRQECTEVAEPAKDENGNS